MEAKKAVNIDYVGGIVLSGNMFKYTKFDIEKSKDILDELQVMIDNPNRTRMDLQSLFQIKFPNKQYFNYSLPYSYNDSYIADISYPPIWDQTKYQQELDTRLSRYPATIRHSYLNDETKKIKEDFYRKCVRYIMGFDLNRAIEKLKSNPAVLMYSTEIIGRTTMVYKISADITITLKTNFSYGSASYFFVNLNYKGIDFLPYSAIIRYYKVNMVDFIRYTRQYYPERKYWDTALTFVADTSNFAKNYERDFLHQWCIKEIDEMISGLHNIKKCSDIRQLTFDESKDHEYVYVRNINAAEKERAKVYPKEMTMAFKAEKITGALCLLEKMQRWTEIYEEVNDRIEKIKQINIDILPEIETAIVNIENDIMTNRDIIEGIRENELKPLLAPIAEWGDKEKVWLSEQEAIYINGEKERILSKENWNDEEKDKQIKNISWPSWQQENAKKEFREKNKGYQELLTKQDETFTKINAIERDNTLRTNFISQLSESKSRIINAKIVACA